MDGVEMIRRERMRHETKGFTADLDDFYRSDELAKAAACHAVAGLEDTFIVINLSSPGVCLDDAYPWEPELDTRDKHSRLENLVIAGSLICAEIDRLLRAEK